MPKSKFTKIQIDEVLKQSNDFWDKATDTMAPLFAMVNDYERLWRVRLPKDLEEKYDQHKDMSQLAQSDVYVNIKSLRAAMRTLLFSRKPFATLSRSGKPNIRDESIIKAEMVLQSMLDEQHDGSGFESDADKTIHQALYAGITCVMTYWQSKKVRVPIRNAANQLILDETTGYAQFEEKVVSEYAETKSIDIRRSRIDPSAESTKAARIVGYHTTVPLNELLDNNKDEEHFYKFNQKDLIDTTFDDGKYYEYSKNETERSEAKENEGFGDKIVEVREIRGLFRFTLKNKSFEVRDLVVHIGNATVVLGVKDNDLPLHGWELFDWPTVDQETDKMYPMGVVEPMFDAVIEKFVKRNQSLDEANRATYDMYIGDEAACANLPDQIEFVRGKINLVDTVAAQLNSVSAAIQPLARSSSGQDTFFQSEALGREIQKGQGLNDYVQPGNPNSTDTATAVTELVSGARSLTVQMVKILKDTYFAPVYCKQMILWNFFKGHEENTVYDEKGDPYTLQAGDVDFSCKVEIDVATALDKPDMIRRFIEMLPLLKTDPLLDQYAVTKTQIDLLKLPNPERLLVPNEHLNTILERENAALIEGVEQKISQYDNHSLHIESHVEALDFASANDLGVETEQFIQLHIEEHQEFIQQQSGALGNTKELGGNAANAGNQANPEVASRKPVGVS